jgi:hypothetical protein
MRFRRKRRTARVFLRLCASARHRQRDDGAAREPCSGAGPDRPIRAVGWDVVVLASEVSLASAIVQILGTGVSHNLQVYNALKENIVLTLNNNYASWLTLQKILSAGFPGIGVHFDF